MFVTAMEMNFQRWIEEKKLLHFKVVKVKKGRKEIWGRMISFDEQKGNLLIYNDDEKKIDNINLNEIEDIIPAK